MPSSVLAPLELSAAERAQLESWTRRRTSAQALALRSRIVLLAADGRKNTEIARELGVHRNVAGKWRSRFLEHRLDGLTDEPRPGQPRKITDEMVEEVIVKTLETTPKDATQKERDKLIGVLSEIDKQVGRLLDALPENTLLIFASDNGALPTLKGERNVGLRGSKLSLYEGGTRLPFIAR